MRRSNLSDVLASEIAGYLLLKPKEETHFNRFQKNRYFSNREEEVKEPFPFFFVDQLPIANGLTEKIISLPFFFGRFFTAKNRITLEPMMNHPIHPFSFVGELRPDKQSVIEEALQHLESFQTTTLALYPGFGKTILGALLAAKYGLITVVLVHRDNLMKQWLKTFSRNTTANIWMVGEKTDKAFHIGNPDLRYVTGSYVFNVIICMDQRVKMIPPVLRSQIGMLLVDEAHCFCTPTRTEAILKFRPRYIIIETATPVKKNGLHSALLALVGPHKIWRKNLKPFEIHCIKTMVKPTREHFDNGRIKWHEFQRSLAEHPYRNQYIVHLVETNPTRKILVLTYRADHAGLLTRMINEKLATAGPGGVMKPVADEFSGNMKAYVDRRILVGTSSKIGTGFDQEAFCEEFDGASFDLVIMLATYRDENVVEQNFGRGFRSKHPAIIYFLDDDNICKTHWGVVKSWSEIYQATITMSTTYLDFPIHLGYQAEFAPHNYQSTDDRHMIA